MKKLLRCLILLLLLGGLLGTGIAYAGGGVNPPPPIPWSFGG